MKIVINTEKIISSIKMVMTFGIMLAISIYLYDQTREPEIITKEKIVYRASEPKIVEKIVKEYVGSCNEIKKGKNIKYTYMVVYNNYVDERWVENNRSVVTIDFPLDSYDAMNKMDDVLSDGNDSIHKKAFIVNFKLLKVYSE